MSDGDLTYLNRQGESITFHELSRLVREAEENGEDYTRIGWDEVGEMWVSTIFLLFKSRTSDRLLSAVSDPEHPFETIVFCGDNHDDIKYQVRWKTEEDAIKGHAVMVELVTTEQRL